jgi:hypothetical protein
MTVEDTIDDLFGGLQVNADSAANPNPSTRKPGEMPHARLDSQYPRCPERRIS